MKNFIDNITTLLLGSYHFSIFFLIPTKKILSLQQNKMSPSALRLPQRASVEHIWKSFDTFLFDADGVLWREQNTLDGAVELVQKLVAAGKRVLVVTNNSTRDSNEHATKLAKMNFKGWQIN